VTDETAEPDERGDARPPRQEQEEATTDIGEVAPGILRLQLPVALPGLGHVNCYALEDERGFALVDPGLPGDAPWAALIDRLDRAGIALRHVHTVVVTHSHHDHFGAAERLHDETSADIVAHEAFRLMWEEAEMTANEDSSSLELTDDEILERMKERFRWTTPWGTKRTPPPDDVMRMFLSGGRGGRLFPTPEPTIRVADRAPVRLGRREWVSVHTPGHTRDHLCLYDPEGGVMLSGDHILPTITPHISGYFPEADPLALFFDSLDRMTRFEGVTITLPAHGHPFADLAGRAEAIAEHHHERLDLIRASVDEIGEGSVVDFMQRLFRPRSWGEMAESETFAHLVHLRATGDIEQRESDGVALFSAP